MIKYIIYPGHVTSKEDGDRHYISAGELMHLYKVSIKECVIIRSERDHYKLRGFKRDLIQLYPRYDGDYSMDLKK